MHWRRQTHGGLIELHAQTCGISAVIFVHIRRVITINWLHRCRLYRCRCIAYLCLCSRFSSRCQAPKVFIHDHQAFVAYSKRYVTTVYVCFDQSRLRTLKFYILYYHTHKKTYYINEHIVLYEQFSSTSVRLFTLKYEAHLYRFFVFFFSSHMTPFMLSFVTLEGLSAWEYVYNMLCPLLLLCC